LLGLAEQGIVELFAVQGRALHEAAR
jgi:hypothetical protein